MIRRLLIFALLSVTTVNLSADQDTLKFEGFKQPISMQWNGRTGDLQRSLNFCIRLDNHTKFPIPSKIDFSVIRYTLKLLDLNSGAQEFAARQGNSTIPLELTLTGHGRSETIRQGQETSLIDGDTFCNGPGNNLRLGIKAQNLDTIPAGVYIARIRVVASNNSFSIASDQNLELTIRIPKLISIHGDKQISLGTFSHRDLKKTAHLCVYRNGQGEYNLKAEALNTRNNRFELNQQGKTSYLPYQVNIKPKNALSRKVTPNTPVKYLQSSKSVDCREGSNLAVEVIIPKNYAEKAYAGSYNGQLKITVEVQ